MWWWEPAFGGWKRKGVTPSCVCLFSFFDLYPMLIPWQRRELDLSVSTSVLGHVVRFSLCSSLTGGRNGTLPASYFAVLLTAAVLFPVSFFVFVFGDDYTLSSLSPLPKLFPPLDAASLLLPLPLPLLSLPPFLLDSSTNLVGRYRKYSDRRKKLTRKIENYLPALRSRRSHPSLP